MKQGRASHSGMGSTKIEPRSHAVNPSGAGNLGIMRGNHASDGNGDMPFKSIPLYEGRGLQAPMVGQTNHKAGSQGKHK